MYGTYTLFRFLLFFRHWPRECIAEKRGERMQAVPWCTCGVPPSSAWASRNAGLGMGMGGGRPGRHVSCHVRRPLQCGRGHEEEAARKEREEQQGQGAASGEGSRGLPLFDGVTLPASATAPGAATWLGEDGAWEAQEGGRP